MGILASLVFDPFGVFLDNVGVQGLFLGVSLAAIARKLRSGDALVLLVAQLIPPVLVLLLLANGTEVLLVLVPFRTGARPRLSLHPPFPIFLPPYGLLQLLQSLSLFEIVLLFLEPTSVVSFSLQVPTG